MFNMREIFRRKKVAQALRESSLFFKDNRAQRLPIVYGTDNYFMTGDSIWTSYHVPTKDYGFRSHSEQRNLFTAANQWFESFPAEEGSSGQILIINHTKTAQEWADALIRKQNKLASDERRSIPPGFEPYVELSRQAIDAQEFFSRDMYLLTRVGDREDTSTGVRKIIEDLGRALTSGFGLDETQPSGEEKQLAMERAQNLTSKLTRTWLTPEPLKRSKMEWLMRYIDTLGQPTPDPAPVDEEEWGIGKWATTMSSFTRVVDLGKNANNERIRALQMVTPQGEGTSYVAFMPVSVIPNALNPLSNWLYYASAMPFPVDISLRFEIIDPQRATRELDKPIDRADAQAMEEVESGRNPDDITQEQRAQLQEVKRSSRQERKPFAIWQCVMAVYANDAETLKERVTELKVNYENLQIRLEVPPLDQRQLFYQMFPGSDLLVNDWLQRSNTNWLAASAPWFNSNVGSPIDNPALYQGYTVTSQGSTKPGSPVFFDLISVIDEKGRAGNEAIIGSPGSGKMLPLDTLIPTPHGMIQLKDARVGTQIFDDKGQVCRISELHPIERADSYILRFDDGTSQPACEDHRWHVLSRRARENAGMDILSLVGKEDVAFARRLIAEIPFIDPAEEWSVDYAQELLGGTKEVWMEARERIGEPGMGDDKAVLLATHALAVVTHTQHSTPAGFGLGQTLTTKQIMSNARLSGRAHYSIPLTKAVNYPARQLPCDPYEAGTQGDLRPEFALGSINQRLAFLQGVCDAYARVNQEHLSLTSSKVDLLKHVRSIIASLGMKASLRVRKDGMGLLTFTPSMPVFRHSDQAELIDWQNHNKRAQQRYIVGIDKGEAVDMRCITVDSPSHMYLCTDQFLPTHNTVSRGLKSAHENALKGITQCIWDPKNDFGPLKYNARDLLLDPALIQFIELGNPRYTVSLDAIATAEYDPEEGIDNRTSAARDVFAKLLLSLEVEGYKSVINDLVAEIIDSAEEKGVEPRMADAFDILDRWSDGNINISSLSQARREQYADISRQFLRHLTTIRKHSLGAILFTDPAQGALNIKPGMTTIFSAINLKEVITPVQTPDENVDVTISRVIQEAMLSFMRSIVTTLPDEVTKQIYFDEWHVVRRSDAAERFLDWSQRMGRSKRTAITRLSQSAADITEGFVNSIWAGKTETYEEAVASCKLLHIEASETNINTLTHLDKGQFLFRDPDGRVALTQVDFWDSDILDMFNTSAAAKAERRAQKERNMSRNE